MVWSGGQARLAGALPRFRFDEFDFLQLRQVKVKIQQIPPKMYPYSLPVRRRRGYPDQTLQQRHRRHVPPPPSRRRPCGASACAGGCSVDGLARRKLLLQRLRLVEKRLGHYWRHCSCHLWR